MSTDTDGCGGVSPQTLTGVELCPTDTDRCEGVSTQTLTGVEVCPTQTLTGVEVCPTDARAAGGGDPAAVCGAG